MMKTCLRDPILEIFDAARYLDAAVSAHLEGDRQLASQLIAKTNTETLRAYINSLWGAKSEFVRPSSVGAPVPIAPEAREQERMPTGELRLALINRDGYHCRYCRIPVISSDVRKRMTSAYPEALPWGRSNDSQHAAFQVMWLQFDHVVPHARGGDNSPGNVVVACAGCNFAKMNWTVEELGLEDPRERPVTRSLWDGLERFRATP